MTYEIIEGLAQTVEQSWQGAEDNGWHERERSPLEELMLIVTEVSEAAEEFRDDRPPLYYRRADGSVTNEASEAGEDGRAVRNKPEGWLAELADVVIRVGDFVGAKDRESIETIDLGGAILDKLYYNASRGHRHGGKRY